MKNLYLLITVSMLSFTLWSQDTWDLERCVQYAIDHSVNLYQSDLLVEDAKILEMMSRKAQLPNLSGSVSGNANFGRSVDPTTNEFNTAAFISNGFSLGSNMIIYNGGRLKNEILSNQISQDIALEDKESMAITVTINVVRAYFEVLGAQDAHVNAQIQLKTIGDQVAQLEKLVQAGSRARFEVYDLQAQEATAQQQLTLAQNRIDLALLNLKGIMNLDPMTVINLAQPPVDQMIYTDLDLVQFDQIYDEVLANRPELRSLDLQIKASAVDIDIARSALLPVISAGVSVNSNFSNRAKEVTATTEQLVETSVLIDGDPAVFGTVNTVATATGTIPYFTQIDNNFSYGVGISARIPIYNNYTGKGNVERSKIQLKNLQANKEQYLIDLRNTLGQFLTDAKAAKRNVEAALSVQEAREVAFQNAQKRFDLGAINSYEYISIQDQLNQARTDYTIAKYDYLLKIKILDYYAGHPVALK